MLAVTLHNLYIDPGSGSLLFQMILSGLLTVTVFFKRISLFIKGFLLRKREEVPSENDFPDR